MSKYTTPPAVFIQMSIQSYSSATAESPVSQAVRETRRQGTRMQEGEQVRASLTALMDTYRGSSIVGRVCIEHGDLDLPFKQHGRCIPDCTLNALGFMPLIMCQVPLSVLPYFRFLSEEAQRNVMSQLIDNFQTTSIGKRGVASTSSTSAATSSASSPGGLAFMRSPFAKVTCHAVHSFSFGVHLGHRGRQWKSLPGVLDDVSH